MFRSPNSYGTGTVMKGGMLLHGLDQIKPLHNTPTFNAVVSPKPLSQSINLS